MQPFKYSSKLGKFHPIIIAPPPLSSHNIHQPRSFNIFNNQWKITGSQTGLIYHGLRCQIFIKQCEAHSLAGWQLTFRTVVILLIVRFRFLRESDRDEFWLDGSMWLSVNLLDIILSLCRQIVWGLSYKQNNTPALVLTGRIIFIWIQ